MAKVAGNSVGLNSSVSLKGKEVPVWQRLRYEAEEAARREPALAGFLMLLF